MSLFSKKITVIGVAGTLLAASPSSAAEHASAAQ